MKSDIKFDIPFITISRDPELEDEFGYVTEKDGKWVHRHHYESVLMQMNAKIDKLNARIDKEHNARLSESKAQDKKYFDIVATL